MDHKNKKKIKKFTRTKYEFYYRNLTKKKNVCELQALTSREIFPTQEKNLLNFDRNGPGTFLRNTKAIIYNKKNQGKEWKRILLHKKITNIESLINT